MTVAELLTHLAALPPDAVVYLQVVGVDRAPVAADPPVVLIDEPGYPSGEVVIIEAY